MLSEKRFRLDSKNTVFSKTPICGSWNWKKEHLSIGAPSIQAQNHIRVNRKACGSSHVGASIHEIVLCFFASAAGASEKNLSDFSKVLKMRWTVLPRKCSQLSYSSCLWRVTDLFARKVLETLLPNTCTKGSRMANTSLGCHLKQAELDPRALYRLANACILALLVRKTHIVFERPYASAAGASEESFSIFVMFFLKTL